MRRGLSARILAASVLLALVVAGVFAVLIVAIGNLRSSASLVRRSDRVQTAMNDLERRAIDLETGERGFIVTGQNRFLEPWYQALDEIPARERELRALIVSKELRVREAAIETALRSYIDEWALPTVSIARVNRAAASRKEATGEGKRRMDAIRARFADFLAVGSKLAAERVRRADAAGRRALLFGAGGLAGLVLLVLLFALYLARAIVDPVRRFAEAADRLATGDLSTRVPESGSAEIHQLGRAFNAMAGRVQESRDELESQNAELEVQTAELEDQQVQLGAANDELRAQQGELERAVGQLGEEKERIEAFFRFGERIASETDVKALGGVVLGELADFAQAELGTLYVLTENGNGGSEGLFTLLASRGFAGDRLPDGIRLGEGLPGRALEERRAVWASYGETRLRLPYFGEDVSVAHELNVPLRHGDRILGVLTLARVAGTEFSEEEREAIEHLGGQAAVALANGLSFEQAVRVATINKVVLDAARDGIRLVDVEGKTLVANEAIDTMTHEAIGLPRGLTLQARSDAITARVADPEAWQAATEELETNPEREAVDEFELVDSGRAFQRYMAPVRDHAGALIGRIIVLREITVERAAERMKNELVATVSHELRTPLASILGFAELLVDREVDPETGSRYLETIYKEARRLTELINDFLDLQRIEEGRFRLTPAPFELGDLLHEQVELYSGQSAEHELDLVLPDQALPVVAERDRIAQVLGNLLSNAVKYSPSGGIVSITAACEGGSVRISVSDRGLGIPADQQARIFGKFFRVDTSDTREIGGTGLGLALSREIIEAHGGRIGFDSVEGEGSTFWFELPASGVASEEGERRVLVVEDDPAAASLLRDYLEGDGLAVETATTGEAALVRAAEDPPAVICLDIGLAGALDGWQVLARLKAAPATSSIPVVVCTAGEGREQAAALGAADFLTKPFSGRRLKETVGRLLPADRGTILVVDDEENVRRLVAETLAGDGVELREAANGEEALEAVAENRPDVIVLDLMMPVVDGFEVMERLWGDPELRSIPIIVLTARRLSAEQRSSLSRRAISLLEKSEYSAHELRGLINRALGERSGATA